jgi:glutamate formiminotransferase / formiminotetrahydrofolate cyclodeaminase
MNLVNTEATPIHRVLALVREEAARHGAAISGCEVVGLVPEYAMLDAAEHYLQLESFRRDQVLELRLKAPPLTEAASVASFFDSVASPTPTPGGGTVSAFAGALAATLPAMVAGLTLGKKKYAAHEEAMKEVRREAAALRGRLLGLARRDSEAFEAVLRARKLPQTSPADAETRGKAMAAADLEAMRVPLETARGCLEVLELAAVVAERGNVHAASDSGVAGLLAHAAAEGALLNVEINLKSAGPSADKTDIEMSLQRIRSTLGQLARRCQDAVRAALSA